MTDTNVGIRGSYFWPGWDTGSASELVDPVVVSQAITLFHIYWPIRITPDRVHFRTESATSVTTAIGLYAANGSSLTTSGKLTHSTVAVQTITLSPVVEITAGMVLLAMSNSNEAMVYRGAPIASGLAAFLNAGDIPWISRAAENSGVGTDLPASVTLGSGLDTLNGLPWLHFLADQG